MLNADAPAPDLGPEERFVRRHRVHARRGPQGPEPPGAAGPAIVVIAITLPDHRTGDAAGGPP